MNKPLSASRLSSPLRRASTVQAVLDLAAVQNPAEITTSAIAEHMQITQGALFRHFATKEAIWQAVMEWVAERILARVDAAAQSAHSPLAALEAVRSRRAQLSALQSLMSAFKSEAELAR